MLNVSELAKREVVPVKATCCQNVQTSWISGILPNASNSFSRRWPQRKIQNPK